MFALPVDEPELGVGLVGVEVGDVVGKQGFAQEHGGDDVHVLDFGRGAVGSCVQPCALRCGIPLYTQIRDLDKGARLPLGVAGTDIEQGGGEKIVGDAVAVFPLVRAVE